MGRPAGLRGRLIDDSAPRAAGREPAAAGGTGVPPVRSRGVTGRSTGDARRGESPSSGRLSPRPPGFALARPRPLPHWRDASATRPPRPLNCRHVRPARPGRGALAVGSEQRLARRVPLAPPVRATHSDRSGPDGLVRHPGTGGASGTRRGQGLIAPARRLRAGRPAAVLDCRPPPSAPCPPMPAPAVAGSTPIHIDPDILGGTPVFPGTRVPVDTLFVYLRKGYRVEGLPRSLSHRHRTADRGGVGVGRPAGLRRPPDR